MSDNVLIKEEDHAESGRTRYPRKAAQKAEKPTKTQVAAKKSPNDGQPKAATRRGKKPAAKMDEPCDAYQPSADPAAEEPVKEKGKTNKKPISTEASMKGVKRRPVKEVANGGEAEVPTKKNGQGRPKKTETVKLNEVERDEEQKSSNGDDQPEAEKASPAAANEADAPAKKTARGKAKKAIAVVAAAAAIDPPQVAPKASKVTSNPAKHSDEPAKKGSRVKATDKGVSSEKAAKTVDQDELGPAAAMESEPGSLNDKPPEQQAKGRKPKASNAKGGKGRKKEAPSGHLGSDWDDSH